MLFFENSLLEKYERQPKLKDCLLYTSDAADERSSVDLGGRRIIKKKKTTRIIEAQRHRKINTKHDNDNEWLTKTTTKENE